MFRATLEGMVTGTSKSHQRVQPKALPNINCIIPPSVLIRTFEASAKSIFQRIEINRQQVVELSSIRNTLLPKLISGELRVGDADALKEAV